MSRSVQALHEMLFERWYALPTLSAALLILSFHPFNVWPLSFIALAPLYYFVAAYPERTLGNIFLGGFTTGALFALSLSYFTVIQFQWLPETYLFNTMVRFSFAPIALLGGLLAGGAMVFFRLLRTRSALINAPVGAAVYTAAEMALYLLCGGYYFAMLAYAGAQAPLLLSLAPVGGAFLVTFAIAWINTLIAEAAAARSLSRMSAAALVPLAAFFCLGAGHAWYLRASEAPTATLEVAAVQVASKREVEFGRQKGDSFVAPEVAKLLSEASTGSPDLLIYPFSPVEGALYGGKKEQLTPDILIAERETFARWLRAVVPAQTTAMVWTNLYEDGNFHNDFLFFREGEVVATYRKRALFPFIDYTPQWAQRLGFYTTSIDFTPGAGDGIIALPEVSAAGLLCSEIQRQDLARAYSGKVPLIVSAGSEALFADALASTFSLKAAQFRAAENNLQVIRSNILGPSAFIERDGSLIAYLPRGEGGVLRGELALYTGAQTLYSRLGDAPLFVALGALIIGALVYRKRYGH